MERIRKIVADRLAAARYLIEKYNAEKQLEVVDPTTEKESL